METRETKRRGVRSRGKGKNALRHACHVQIVICRVLVQLGMVQNLKLWCLRPHVEGDLLVSLSRSSPCKWRHLRAVRCTTVTQQLGTGSGDPAANWNFRLCVKLCARLGCGQSTRTQLCSPAGSAWSPQEAPQSLSREAPPCRMFLTAGVRQGRRQPSFRLCSLQKGRPGRDGDAAGVCEAWFRWPMFRRQLLVVPTSPASRH